MKTDNIQLKPLILVIDDNAENLDLLRRILKKNDFDVQTADTGQDGLSKAKAEPPDLVLLDIKMPEMDGFEVSRHLKNDDILSKTPIIFISGIKDVDAKVRGFELGAVDFISKPFYAKEVVSRINTHLSLYRLKQDLEETIAVRTAELDAAREHFQTLFELASDIFLIHDFEGNLIDANRKALYDLGYSKSDLLAMNISDIEVSYSQNQIDHLFMKPSEPVHQLYDGLLIHQNGNTIDVEINRGLFQRSNPKLFLAIARNISTRKQTERQLMQSESRFKALFEQAGDYILILENSQSDDSSLIISDLNRAAAEIHGYQKEELIGKSIYMLDSEIGPARIKSMQTQLNIGEQVLFETVHKRKDGTQFPVEASIKMISGDSGKNRFISIERDISIRKKREQEIRRNADIVDNIRSGIHVYHLETPDDDRSLRLVSINRAASEITGIDKEKLIGKTLDENFPGLRELGIPQKYAEAIRSQKTVDLDSFQYADQRIRPAIFSVIAIPLSDDHVGAIFEDITEKINYESERDKLQEQLIQAQKMEAIGTLAGGIAHDFNNILGVIMGYTEMTLDHPDDPKMLQKNLQNVFNASLRAKEMVQQILAFSRKNEKTMSSINISKIVRETINFLRSSIPTTIEIKSSIERNVGLVFGNGTQINQVLMNLATNASHAMKDKGGVLEIYLKQADLSSEKHRIPSLEPGIYIQLSVKDSGCGMNRELIDRIFEPYFTTKRSGEGTGMGLAVTYGIVKSHMGEIQVQSEPGAGTVFDVYFPKIEYMDASSEPNDLSEIPMGNNESILLVDDEEVLADLSSQMIGKLGYRVESMHSSVEALNHFRKTPEKYDLVITDMTMPNMTGIQLTGEIHKIRSGIPVILCTGYSKDLKQIDLKKLGVDALVMKPVIKKKIAKVIREILENHK